MRMRAAEAAYMMRAAFEMFTIIDTPAAADADFRHTLLLRHIFAAIYAVYCYAMLMLTL